MTLPVIFGWSEQKYGNVPAALNVNENVSLVSSTFDLNTLSVLTTVCGMSSRLTQVTVVPAGTVSSAGPNVKLSILTSFVPVPACAPTARRPGPTASDASPSHTAANSRTDTLLLTVTSLPWYVVMRGTNRR